MSEYLPLFPLSSVIFPGEQLRLYIFESRYKQLINEAHERSSTFGIPPVLENQILGVFTEVGLTQIDRVYEGGEMDIQVTGIRRAKILRFDEIAPNKEYPGGEIEWLDSDERSDSSLQKTVYELLNELNEVLGFKREKIASHDQINAFRIGHQVGLSLQQECKLLSIDSETERLSYIRDHIRKILPTIRSSERAKVKAKLNGHFKDAQPPDY